MSLGFTERCLNNACAAVMEVTASKKITENEDCSDFTDPEIVKKYLIKVATDEYTKNFPVESGKIYGCVYKNVFVGFENVSILDGVFTLDGSKPTCVALFWKTLGF
jgi:hypothetical protein